MCGVCVGMCVRASASVAGAHGGCYVSALVAVMCRPWWL